MALSDIALKEDPGPDENSDEIPAVTIVPLTDNKIKQLNTKKYAARRVIKLYITHLLDTDIVTLHNTMEKHFVFKDLTFRNIMLRGTVIGLQFLKFKTKPRTLLSIDDGTGIIDCYVEHSQFLENTREQVQTQVKDTTEMFEMAPTNNMLKAALMMLQSAKERVNKLVYYESFRLGDTVELIGTMSEYNGKRSCFVLSIVQADCSGNTRYLEQLDELYQTTY